MSFDSDNNYYLNPNPKLRSRLYLLFIICNFVGHFFPFLFLVNLQFIPVCDRTSELCSDLCTKNCQLARGYKLYRIFSYLLIVFLCVSILARFNKFLHWIKINGDIVAEQSYEKAQDCIEYSVWFVFYLIYASIFGTHLPSFEENQSFFGLYIGLLIAVPTLKGLWAFLKFWVTFPLVLKRTKYFQTTTFTEEFFKDLTSRRYFFPEVFEYQDTSFLSLPSEVLFRIAEFLPLHDLVRFSQTCKQIYVLLIPQPPLWRRVILKQIKTRHLRWRDIMYYLDMNKSSHPENQISHLISRNDFEDSPDLVRTTTSWIRFFK